MYYTYVLRSLKDGKQYIGHTKDFEARFKLHQEGKVTSTSYRKPFEVVYFEACRSLKDAITREKYFKTHFGKMFLKKRLKSDSK